MSIGDQQLFRGSLVSTHHDLDVMITSPTNRLIEVLLGSSDVRLALKWDDIPVAK